MKGHFQVSENFLGGTGIPAKTMVLTFSISFMCHAILIGALFFLPEYSNQSSNPFPSAINVSLVSLKGFDKISGDMPENQPGNKERVTDRPAGMPELPGDSIQTDIPPVSGVTESNAFTGLLPPSAADKGYKEGDPKNGQDGFKQVYNHPAGEMQPVSKIVKEAVPLYKENPAPVYPMQAKKRGYEGTVILEVLVTKEGMVGKVNVFQSSRHPLLDQAAVLSVKKWRFEPGKRGDEKVDMPVRVPIRFKLESD